MDILNSESSMHRFDLIPIDKMGSIKDKSVGKMMKNFQNVRWGGILKSLTKAQGAMSLVEKTRGARYVGHIKVSRLHQKMDQEYRGGRNAHKGANPDRWDFVELQTLKRQVSWIIICK